MNEDLQVLVDRAETALGAYGPPAEDNGADEYRTFSLLVDLMVRFKMRGYSQAAWDAAVSEAREFADNEIKTAQGDDNAI